MGWRRGVPNRTLCDVLEEMRQCNKTRNYAPLPGLIEEVQSMANRMEAALYEQKDYESWQKKVKEERRELKRLIRKTNKLRKKHKEKKKEFPKYV